MRFFLSLLITAVLTGYTVHEVDDRYTESLRTQHALDLEGMDKLSGRIVELEGELATARTDNDDLRNRLSDAAERERAAKVRASRSRRVTASIPLVWTHSVRGIKIANCESADLRHWPYSDGARYLGGEKGIHLRDPNGHYGKWQFAPATWRSVGGRGNPADASEAEQDMRAEMLYVREKERPWECRLKV